MQFKNQEELEAHARLTISCELQAYNPVDGISSEVKEQLRSRKKTPGQSEADRWRDIYQLLFPGTPVPSPCKSCHLVLYLIIDIW
jgi:hypothetical protein